MREHAYSMFFLGFGLGIGAGMLFAPKRGSETRDFLMSKADEGREYVRQKSYELRDSASGMIDKGRGYMGRQRSNFHEAVEAGKDAYRETVHTNEPVHHI